MDRQRRVRVVVDSGSCLPDDIRRDLGITVVPHRLTIGDYTYLDGVEILPSEFYRILRSGDWTPTTSAPSPGDFLRVFSDAAGRGEDVLCLTPAAGFSVTHQSALSAKDLARQCAGDCDIEIVDTGTAAGGAGLVAVAAAECAANGSCLGKVVRKVKTLARSVRLAAYLDTLEHLRRGGRIGRIPSWAGGLLGVRPVVELRDGEAQLIARPRSRARAADRLMRFIRGQSTGERVRVNVMEADAPDDAAALLSRIRDEFECVDSFTSQFTPVMGAHTGPGVVAVALHTVGCAKGSFRVDSGP